MKKLFISYHTDDQILYDELTQQLKPLQKAGLITISNNQNIAAGQEIQTAISEYIQQSDLILLLLSSDLLNADSVTNFEIPLAMQLHETGKTKVIPLIARPCLWEETALVACSPLPENRVPITSKTHWDSSDEPYLHIAKKIKDWLEKTEGKQDENAIIATLKQIFNHQEADAAHFPLFFKNKDKDFFLPEYHHRLAWHYEKGKGCNVDYELAIFHYEKATKQGYHYAFLNLGIMYENGKGTQVDYEKAFFLYEEGAIRGNISAQNNLGRMYNNGHFVPKDYVLAKEWYEKAAMQGSQYAQSNLAYLYLKGLGTVVNKKEALNWYKKAAAQGNAVAIKAIEQWEK